ncbi:MAG: phenylalanine--tRNA ligase subunit alpha [candidate division Zixibacteria bacterium]|nr:phenylalanine--tRNA ligase subunit alpha [candidate division Zixibacteria bacterium]
MSNFEDDLKEAQREAFEELAKVDKIKELEELKIKYLGRKGIIPSLLKNLTEAPVESRPTLGKLANEVKNQVEGIFNKRIEELKIQESPEKKRTEVFDYTLPGRRGWSGKLHPITQISQQIIEIFYGMGFEVAKGPDVETDYYNFGALNFPKDHPARDMQDTFYVNDDILLRTHTSPVQVRVMEKRKPPLRIIAPGRCYRHEAINARSFCTFHQVEGFYVDTNVTFADLKGVLSAFVWELFGKEVAVRFRGSFFPFTEPSAEMDIACVNCKGKGCGLCKYRGWLEILGAGMIDPEVFKNVGYDPEVYTGYAFGMGVERIAMLRYGIDDIRLFYENDLRFLRQFLYES